MRIADIPRDKLLHFAAGCLAAAAGVVLAPLAAQVGYAGGQLWLGAGACAAAAVWREARNKRAGGKFDPRDIAATLLGGVPVLVAVGATQ